MNKIEQQVWQGASKQTNIPLRFITYHSIIILSLYYYYCSYFSVLPEPLRNIFVARNSVNVRPRGGQCRWVIL
jgi:hypothetical protein